jgi:hypothetical protein
MPPIPPGGAPGAAPAAGAATPTIVPFSLLGTPGAAPALGAPAPTDPGPLPGPGAPGAPAAGRGPPGAGELWFIMSIVPLNFGAALFIANPHLVQVCAVSGF